MKIARAFLVACLVSSGIIITSCRPPVLNKETAARDNTVLVRADRGYALTRSGFFDILYRSRMMVYGGVVAEPDARWLLDSLVLDTLTGFAADDLDIGKYYNDNWTFRMRYHTALIGKYCDLNVAEKVKVDSQEVVDYHQKHPDMFTLKEQAYIYHIMTSPKAFLEGHDSLLYRALTPDSLAKAVRDYAFHLRRLVDSGMPFKEVATRFSQDVTTKDRGGDMGWVSKGVYRAPFDSVVFALKPGEYSQPYLDQDGWHVLLMSDYLPEGPSPLDRPDFYTQAEQALVTERQGILLKKIVDSLSKGMDLKINDKILDTDLLLVADSIWAGVVNTVDTIDVQMMKTTDDAYRGRYRVSNTTANMKKAIINSLASWLLLAQAARRDKVDTLPDMKVEWHRLHHSGGKSLLIQRWWDRDWKPSDSAIAEYYKQHPGEFLVEKPLTVQQIVSKDSVTALFLRDQAMSGIDFMQLAKEYYPGESNVRQALADLGKIGPRDVDTNFYMAAFGTPVGEVSMPVKTQYGWHIIKVLAHEESKSLDKAKPQIAVKLEDQFRRAEMLKKKDKLAALYHAEYVGKLTPVFLEPVAYRTK